MAVINGTNGDDYLEGTNNNDTINGKAGADIIEGLGGNDSVDAGGGDDLVFGGPGDDKIYGKGGLDNLFGEDGNDSLYGDDYTDVLSGGTGDDILKGGLGEATMHGNAGDDDFYYNPFKGKISDINDSLAGSYLGGDDGYDTLNIFNETTYTDDAGKTQNGWTYIGIDQTTFNTGDIYYEPKPGDGAFPWAFIGTFSGIEEIKAEGEGGLKFYGGNNQGFKVTGTKQGDTFQSSEADDTFLGGGGNDTFIFNAGDVIESWTGDSDMFHFWDLSLGGKATLTGFNGAGKDGGDELTMKISDLGNPSTQIVESGGKTIFTLNSGDALEVDAVGLKQNVDYFFV